MAKLKKLERLDLGDNEIEELPPHIGALVSLEGNAGISASVADPDTNLQAGSVFGIRIRFLEVKLSYKIPLFQQRS